MSMGHSRKQSDSGLTKWIQFLQATQRQEITSWRSDEKPMAANCLAILPHAQERRSLRHFMVVTPRRGSILPEMRKSEQLFGYLVLG